MTVKTVTSNIYRITHHPKGGELSASFDAPNGTWVGTLVDRAWDIGELDGQPLTLYCYFQAASKKHPLIPLHRLAVHRDRDFKPNPESPSFLDAPLGSKYKIESVSEGENQPKFLKAELA